MIRQVVAAGLFIGAIVTSLPAHAASCADRDRVVERLKARYDESFSAGGLQAGRDTQTLVEVWSSQETGTFTVMLTSPNGLTCVVATGTDWHQVTGAPDAKGSSS